MTLALEIDHLNRMFEAAFSGTPAIGGTWMPAVDIYETPDKDVVLKADLPDMKREDIKITFENDVLTLEGDRKFAATDRERYQRVERGYGAFRRAFTLPSSVDGGRVQAAYVNGVLTITLPRREESRPRQIEIKG